MNAFEVLGIEERLDWTEEALREALRRAGKTHHPDAGGEEGDFARLREAYAILSSPSRRLRHWLELRGIEVERRGSIDGGLMDLFGFVGVATQCAEAVIRKRDDAKSALTRALLEGEAQSCREQVEELIGRVDGELNRLSADFAEIAREQTTIPADELGKRIRDLSFLEKWKAGLRSVYARLV